MRPRRTVSFAETSITKESSEDEMKERPLLRIPSVMDTSECGSPSGDDSGDLPESPDEVMMEQFSTLGVPVYVDDDFLPLTPYEEVLDAQIAYNVPSPASMSTRAKAKGAQASYLTEKLLADKDTYDPEIFFICRKYHELHRKQHKILKRETHARLSKEMQEQSSSERLEQMFNDPQSSRGARILAAVDFLFVLWTIIQMSAETIPSLNSEFDPSKEKLWFALELLVTVFFTLETLLRFIVASDKKHFFVQPLNIMDILSILPFYFSFVISGELGMLKLLRMARYLKLMRVLKYFDVLVVTIENISRPLVAPVAFLGVSVLVISTGIYFAERGTFRRGNYLDGIDLNANSSIEPEFETVTSERSVWNGLVQNASFLLNASSNTTLWNQLSKSEQKFVYFVKTKSRSNKFTIEDCHCTETAAHIYGDRPCPDVPAHYDSVYDAMWFTVVTMTTVGYGTPSHQPVCGAGKMIASINIILSTVFLAMPIAIVGVRFTDAMKEAREAEMEKKKKNAETTRTYLRSAEIAPEAKKKRSRNVVSEVASALKKKIGSGVRILKRLSFSKVDAKQHVERKRQRRARREAQRRKMEESQNVKSAAEALLLHIAVTLQRRYFNFACADGGPEFPTNTLGDASCVAESSSSQHTPLPTSIVHHFDAFLSYLLERWTAEYVMNPPVASAAQSPGIAMLATLSPSEQRAILKSLHTFQWFSKLHAIEGTARKGFARELSFSRLIEYNICAIPPPPSSGTRVAESTWRLPESCILNIYCKWLVLPQHVAKIQVLHAFLTRIVLLISTSPFSHSIAVNGKIVSPETDPRGGISDEDGFAVQLNHGDVINFTPVMRLCTATARGGSSVLPSAPSTKRVAVGGTLKEPTSQLEKMGIRPIIYVVNFEATDPSSVLRPQDASAAELL